MHINDREECNWIRDKFEVSVYEEFNEFQKKVIYEWLLWATMFGDFLGNKFNTMKRFGLEGCESFIPGIKGALRVFVEQGVEKCVVGMPHRGRLNVLTNVMRKPLAKIFAEF